jgi:hypothetical protein
VHASLLLLSLPPFRSPSPPPLPASPPHPTTTHTLYLISLSVSFLSQEVLRNADRFDPWAVNKKGFSAVDLARDFNYPELADYIREKLPGIIYC